MPSQFHLSLVARRNIESPLPITDPGGYLRLVFHSGSARSTHGRLSHISLDAAALYRNLSAAAAREWRPEPEKPEKKLKNNHYNGDACSSTLRLMLGCILQTGLSIVLRIPGPYGNRVTFGVGVGGDKKLCELIAECTRVAYATCLNPWEVEES